jgi:rhodanese-related sulfurtransferase
VIVDVRAREDYDKGHIPGAINLPREAWETQTGLSENKTNLIYCYSHVCHLAARAALLFASRGFSVMEMDGGWKAWQQHRGEVETKSETPRFADKANEGLELH